MIKEEFCGACVALPFAIAGVGTAGIGSRNSHKKIKIITLIVGILVTIISLIVSIYFLTRCKHCR